MSHGFTDKFNVDACIDLPYQLGLWQPVRGVRVSDWYCCGQGSLSMVVSPFFVLTLLDQNQRHVLRGMSSYSGRQAVRVVVANDYLTEALAS